MKQICKIFIFFLLIINTNCSIKKNQYIIDDKNVSYIVDDCLNNIIAIPIENIFIIKKIIRKKNVFIITVEDYEGKQYEIYSPKENKGINCDCEKIIIGKDYNLVLFPYFKYDYKYGMRVDTYRRININGNLFYSNRKNVYLCPSLNGKKIITK